MSKHRKAGGSAFGLALLVMLVLGAFAANGAQASTWHIDGTQFSGKESIAWSGGPIEFKNNGWGATIKCNSLQGSAQIQESKYSTGTLTFSSCSVLNVPACTVKPLSLGITGQLIDTGGEAYERYNASGSWTITGSQCSLGGEFSVSGTIAAKIGFEAVSAIRTFSAAAEEATGAKGLNFFGDPWKVSGDSVVSLTGSNYGREVGTGIGGTGGAWTPGEPAFWSLDEEVFEEEEEVEWVPGGSQISLIASDGFTVKCGSATSTSMSIYAGDQVTGSVKFSECYAPKVPACSEGWVELDIDGHIGLDLYDELVYEKLIASGQWLMLGGGCPVIGLKPVSGAFAAWVNPQEGMNTNVFDGAFSNLRTKSPGLGIGGKLWRVTGSIRSALANSPGEFGVIW